MAGASLEMRVTALEQAVQYTKTQVIITARDVVGYADAFLAFLAARD